MKKLTNELLTIAENIYSNAKEYEETDLMDWELVELWGYKLQQLFFKYKDETKDIPTMEEYERWLDTSYELSKDAMEHAKTTEVKKPAVKDSPAEALADIINTLKEVLGE